MKQLICSTSAYKTFAGDLALNRLSHAYMLHLDDSKNLRYALKLFALKFFSESENTADGGKILRETLPDLKVYPEDGKKLAIDAVSSLIGDAGLKPLERDKKLYLISGFEQASPLVQNKLLKILEEPPEGVYFLIGATTLSPVLDTVKSRVRTLAVPPFSESEIFAALERKGKNPLNAEAAKSCRGIFGVAENITGGGWFEEISSAADEISSVTDAGDIAVTAIKYGETKYKNELLCELSLKYSQMLKEIADDGKAGKLTAPALIFALERVDKAYSDVKFNANFQGLLYELMLAVKEENDKWLKLRA